LHLRDERSRAPDGAPIDRQRPEMNREFGSYFQ